MKLILYIIYHYYTSKYSFLLFVKHDYSKLLIVLFSNSFNLMIISNSLLVLVDLIKGELFTYI